MTATCSAESFSLHLFHNLSKAHTLHHLRSSIQQGREALNDQVFP